MLKAKFEKNKTKIIVTSVLTALAIGIISFGTDIEKREVRVARDSSPSIHTEAQQDTPAEDAEVDDEASSGGLTDGSYTGSGQGFKGDTKVSVEINGGKITDVKVISTGDDDAYFSQAEGLIDEIIKQQGTQGVDAVSGATFSSNGILDAVDNALAEVK